MAKTAIYEMIAAKPARYHALIGLYSALGVEAFADFTKVYAGPDLHMPTENDVQK